MAALTGPIRQVPPQYSAVQIEGRRAYQLARAGEPVELAPRDVVIHEFTLVEWDDSDPHRPVAVTDVACSAGTYIRALARDLGASLGSGAYLGALVRTASGGFRLEDAIGFEALRDGAAGGADGFAALLRPIDAGLEDLPHATITADELRRLFEGLPTGPKTPLEVPDAPAVLAVGPEGTIVAVCRAVGGILHPAQGAHRAPGDGRGVTMETARGLAGLALVRTSRCSSSSACSTASTSATSTCSSTSSARRQRRGARPTVITFDHHPDEVLTGSAPPLLCDPDERVARLAEAGVAATVIVHFDLRLRETTVRGVRRPDRGTRADRGLPDDARCRLRLPARRDARGARGARPDARVRGRRRAAVRARRPARPQLRHPRRDRGG